MNNVALNPNIVTPYNSQKTTAFNNAKDYRFMQGVEPIKSAQANNSPPADEFETVKTAGGAAILLRAAQYGLEKLSEFCATELMSGKEFASREDVEKVANAMKNDKKLSTDIHYLDNSNVGALKRKFPSLGKSLDVVANGGNAFYTNKANFACAPKSKPSLILHELGHATNFEKSMIMRSLQKLRVVGMFAPMAIAYLNKASKPRSDGKKNFWERNAGTIGFCAFLPTIIEEAAASIRGINAAKKTLGAGAKLGALKKNYFLAWMTYLLAGIGTGIAAKLAINSD